MYHITVSPKDCLQCKLSLPLLLIVAYLWQARQKIDYCYKLFHDPSSGAIKGYPKSCEWKEIKDLVKSHSRSEIGQWKTVEPI